jgi:threonine efflux protein
MPSTLLTIALLHWIVLITPGANVLLVSQLAASGHRRSAVFAGLGVSVVALLWALLAILGVNALFAAQPAMRLGLQIGGSLYLLYIAQRLWRSGSAATPKEASPLAPSQAFRLGFLTNILNPKSALFFGSVFASALPGEPGIPLLATAVLLVFINALCWHALLAVAFSNARVQAVYAQQRALLNKLAGAAVGAMGLRLLVATARELRAR